MREQRKEFEKNLSVKNLMINSLMTEVENLRTDLEEARK
jgi:hypothetical protein